MGKIKNWWTGKNWAGKILAATKIALGALALVALVWLLWPSGSDNATQTSSSISTFAQVDSVLKALDQKIEATEKLTKSSAEEAEDNATGYAKQYADQRYWQLAGMDTSMADSLSKRFRSQLNAGLATANQKTAASQENLANISEQVKSNRHSITELESSVAVIGKIARGADAKATQALADNANLRLVLRDLAEGMQGSREPLLFGKKGAVHRAATAAIEKLGGTEDTARAADEQEVMRLLGLESSPADTTAKE